MRYKICLKFNNSIVINLKRSISWFTMLTEFTTYDNSQVSKKSKSSEFVSSITYMIDDIYMQLTCLLYKLPFVLYIF